MSASMSSLVKLRPIASLSFCADKASFAAIPTLKW